MVKVSVEEVPKMGESVNHLLNQLSRLSVICRQ